MTLLTPNATADFEKEVTVTEEDAWGDPVETTEWQTTVSDVPVRFTPTHIQERNSGGDVVRRPAQLKAPMYVDEEGHSTGDRVTIDFRGTVRAYRMIEYGAVTAFGNEGSIITELADWGDDTPAETQ